VVIALLFEALMVDETLVDVFDVIPPLFSSLNCIGRANDWKYRQR